MPGAAAWAARAFAAHRNSLVSLAVRGLALAASVFATVYVGRALGPAATGYYGLVVQSAVLIGTLLIAGNDISVIQHLARGDGRPFALRTVLRLFAPVLLGGGIAAAVLWAAGPARWHGWFAWPASATIVAALPLILAGRAGGRLSGALLRARHSNAAGQIVDALGAPLLTAALLVAVGLSAVDQALAVTAIAAAANGALGVALVLARSSRAPDAAGASVREIYRSGLPLLGASLGITFIDWYALALAANMLDAEAAGQFRLAWQAASVLAVVTIAIFSTYSPRIAVAARDGTPAQVRRLITSGTRVSAAAALPLAIALWLLAEPLLRFVGPGFVGGAWPLRVLVAGQLIAALCGPCGAALSVSGRGRINLAYTLASVAVVAVLGPVLASYVGLVGLAIAVSLGIATRNLAAWVFVARTFPRG